MPGRLLAFASLILAWTAVVATPAFAGCGTSPEIAAAVATMNSERQSRSLAPLRLDPELCAIAERHAKDMVEHHYVSHWSKDGRSPATRMKDAGHPFHHAGENLAVALSLHTAGEAFWNSPEHRENILRPEFRNVGIAVVRRGDLTVMVVEDFSD